MVDLENRDIGFARQSVSEGVQSGALDNHRVDLTESFDDLGGDIALTTSEIGPQPLPALSIAAAISRRSSACGVAVTSHRVGAGKKRAARSSSTSRRSASNCKDLWIKLFERQLATTEMGDSGVSFGAHEADMLTMPPGHDGTRLPLN